MTTYYFLTDQLSWDNLTDKERETLETFSHERIFLKETIIKELDALPADARLLIYLSDENVKKVIPTLLVNKTPVAFLFHPEALALNDGFALPSKLSTALSEIEEVEESMDSDILICNEEPVFSKVVVGEMMDWATRKNTYRLWKRMRSFFSFFKKARSIQAKLFTIQADEKDVLETAATDIVVVPHNKNINVSRVFLENSFANDGMFHTLIFAPRSILQLLGAFLSKYVMGKMQTNASFDFLGLVKTNQLTISATQPFSYVIDNVKMEASQLIFSVEKGLQLIPSKALIVQHENPQSKKQYIVKNLPKGEVKKDMVSKCLPWVRYASTEEYEGLFLSLRENAKPKQTYIVLMILSTILATFGLFSNASPVIIGAMILAPLMAPIISLSMGVLRQDRRLIKSSIITVGLGLGVGYLFAIILTLITPLADLNSEISMRIKPNIIDLGVAVISGAAGAYAHSKEEIAKTLAGVAIAVALVPPLAVSGIGIGWGNWNVFFGAFLLLLTNLTGMVLAGSLTFLLVGFSPFKLAKRGLLVSALVVSALCIPLGYGFYRVVEENRIVNALNYEKLEGLEVKNVEIIGYSPLTLSLTLVSDVFPSDDQLNQVKKMVEKKIEKDVELEIQVSMKK